jgi:sugar/nucleoside kinase (ribokinase family)
MHGRKPYDVITFGDLCVDLIVSGGDIVPRFGQAEQLVERYELEMGGSCALFACQAAKLGLRVGILGRVGDDEFGRLVMRRLDECGVDTRHVTIDPDLKTGLGLALCRNGDRAILTYEGSISALGPGDVSEAFLASGNHLHYGSFFLHTGLRPRAPEILKQARVLGLTISLDTNWDPAERWNSTLAEVLSLTDLLMPNEQEALSIAGCDSLETAMVHLHSLGIPLLAIKRGANGAWAYQGQRRHKCSPPPAKPGGDGVGAGDSFDAGFVAGWLRGLTVEQCLEIGCLCGRAVASQAGGLRGQPTWEEVTASLGL